jgi:hypothetical protein
MYIDAAEVKEGGYCAKYILFESVVGNRLRMLSI